MKQIQVSIKGTAPLLQHKLSAQVESDLAKSAKKQSGQNKRDDIETYLYKNAEGVICQPVEHILQAIIKQLSNYKIQGKGKKTFKELGKGALSGFPELIPHKIQAYTVDSRTVVIPATKGRTVRERPRLDAWELEFTLEILNDDLPSDVVKNALDDAGRESGIGDYRPRFGRFIVTSFKELT